MITTFKFYSSTEEDETQVDVFTLVVFSEANYPGDKSQWSQSSGCTPLM